MSNKIFKDRIHAGELLFEKIKAIINDSTVLVTIPNGGVLVAKQIVKKSNQSLYLVLAKKIPLENIPYVGLGAVNCNDFTYNRERIEHLKLSEDMLEKCTIKACEDINIKSKVLSNYIAKPEFLKDKKVILIDDGIASGYTMFSAIKEIQKAFVKSIIIATPVINIDTKQKLEKKVDGVYYCHLSEESRFVVDEYYEKFKDISNFETLKMLKETVCDYR